MKKLLVMIIAMALSMSNVFCMEKENMAPNILGKRKCYVVRKKSENSNRVKRLKLAQLTTTKVLLPQDNNSSSEKSLVQESNNRANEKSQAIYNAEREFFQDLKEKVDTLVLETEESAHQWVPEKNHMTFEEAALAAKEHIQKKDRFFAESKKRSRTLRSGYQPQALINQTPNKVFDLFFN